MIHMVKGLTKEDVEMLKGRVDRAQTYTPSPIKRMKVDKKRTNVTLQLTEEDKVFDIEDYDSSDKMFEDILHYMNSVGAY